jgi:hypothetical protein
MKAMRTLFLISMIGVGGAAATAAPAPANDDASAVRAELAQRRDEMITALHTYWMRGAFPVNVYLPDTVNIFRDGVGHLCAVANLVHASGRDDLVDAQVVADNYIRLKDLGTDGPLADWILGSGFTREELVDLQGAGYEYMQPKINVEAPQLQLANEQLNGPNLEKLLAERTALRTRLAAAEQKLRADSDASLDVAAARLVAARAKSHERNRR